MTTEKKAQTAEDVDQLYSAVRADVRMHIRVAGERALSGLRDLALLGVQVPGLLADNAALVALTLRTAGVLRDMAGMPIEADFLSDTAHEPHPGAALLAKHEAKVRTLHARVAELERERDHLTGERDGIKAVALDLRSERDALRAQVAELERNYKASQGAHAATILREVDLERRLDEATATVTPTKTSCTACGWPHDGICDVEAE